MGVLVHLLAALQYTRLVHRLQKGTWNADHASRSGVVVAMALALAGIAVTTYLLLVRDSASNAVSKALHYSNRLVRMAIG